MCLDVTKKGERIGYALHVSVIAIMLCIADHSFVFFSTATQK